MVSVGLRGHHVCSCLTFSVEEKRLLDESNSDNESARLIARELRKAMPGPIARKTIKQTVMTTVYGVTNYGAMLQIKRQLRLLGFTDKQSRVFAVYLANLTLTSLDEAFVSSMYVRCWSS
jgi:DNA-directed RNA polymerase